MKNRFEHIDEVIARVLSGEGSSLDNRLVEEWIALSESNAKALEQMKKITEASSTTRPRIEIDMEKAWLRVKTAMQAGSPETTMIALPKRNAWSPWYRIAALLVLVAGLGTAAYFILKPGHAAFDIVITAPDSVRNETLPDGSAIALNRNSTLRYSSGSFQHHRKVELAGEAYFDVVHDAGRPFAVEAGGLTIEDVGTAFNIRAFPDDKLVIVAVASGEVKVLAGDSGILHLAAGETAEFDKTTGEFTKRRNESGNIAPYKDKIFIFENTELTVVVKLLNDVYAGNITLKEADMGKCRITATFHNESIDSILEIISETLNLKINRSGTEIQLTGNGCR